MNKILSYLLALSFAGSVTASIDWTGDTSKTAAGEDTWIIAEAPHTQSAPTIDGVISPGEWDTAVAYSLDFTTHSSMDPAGLEAAFRVMWDETNIYILIEGADGTGISGAGHRFELYISTDYTRKFGQWMLPGYGPNDYQILATIEPIDTFFSLGLYSSQEPLPSFVRANTVTGDSYVSEVRIAWSDLGGLPGPRSLDNSDYIGFEVQVQRGVNNNNRAKLAWAAPVDVAWASTEDWGTLRLLPAGDEEPVGREPGFYDEPALGWIYDFGDRWAAWFGDFENNLLAFLYTGFLDSEGYGWVYHPTKGWLYLHSGSVRGDGLFIFGVDLGWIITGSTWGSSRFYHFDDKTWMDWTAD